MSEDDNALPQKEGAPADHRQRALILPEQVSLIAAALAQQLIAFGNNIAEPLQRHAAAIQRTITDVNRYVSEAHATLVSIAPALLQIIEAAKQLPAVTQNATLVLAQNGWFIAMEMTVVDLFGPVDLFTHGKADDANLHLQNFFEANLAKIEERLVAEHQNRDRFIRSAFAAHRRDDFAASIPLFLAQADGICFDLTKAQLYSRQKPIGPQLRKPDPESATADTIVALLEKLPLTAGSAERSRKPEIFNRHVVVHGESVDYDTRLNSCRAISWISYVSETLSELQKRPPGESTFIESPSGKLRAGETGKNTDT